jgi:hypothetical protein
MAANEYWELLGGTFTATANFGQKCPELGTRDVLLIM